MPHQTPLIATIVIGLGLAFIFGALANRFRIPPLVGYVIAGVLVGPHTPGFIADQNLAVELAEIGVILLMFGVGLHFSLKDLLSVRAIALPVAVVQIGFTTALGAALAWMLGWSIGAGLVFGLALSVASTVVLLPAVAGVLGGNGDAATSAAQSDWFAALGFGDDVWSVIGLTLVKVAAFVALMLVVGRRVIPWILHYVAHTGSRELFRLSVLAIALGVAFGAAKLFGVSLALGAFFAGMIMSESELSHQAAEESLPLRDAFSVLFFVSVGMLFDPASLVDNTWPVLATLFIIVIGKSVAAFLIVVAFGYPIGTALIISASLAQIGEFSFILADLGVGLELLPEQGRDLILAGAILSILLNPLAFGIIGRFQPWLEERLGKKPEVKAAGPATEPGKLATPSPRTTKLDEDDAPKPTKLTGHTILVGYGRVGSLVASALRQAGQPFLVIEDADKTITRLRADGVEVISGNAARTETFAAANPAAAKQLILAIPNAFEAGQVVQKARAAQPDLLIVARAHSDAEVDHLTGLGANTVIMGEREIARGIVESVMTAGQQGTSDVSRGGSAVAPERPVVTGPVTDAVAPASDEGRAVADDDQPTGDDTGQRPRTGS